MVQAQRRCQGGSAQEVRTYPDLTGLSHWASAPPCESSILRFRHLQERHKQADQILTTVDALLQTKGLQL